MGVLRRSAVILLASFACTIPNPDYQLGGGGSGSMGGLTSPTSGGDDQGGESGAQGGESGAQGCEPSGADDATCDGIDDDCDGIVDDDYVPSSACGVGYCEATSTPSWCDDGVEVSCVPGEPIDEVPDDGLDQDCDGEDATSGPPIDSFWDDFEDGVLDPRWAEPDCTDGCSAAETGGQMQFSLGAAGPCECTVSTEGAYSLLGQAVVLDVPSITNFFEPLRFFMAAEEPGGDTIEYGFDGSDVFYARVEVDGVTTFAQTSVYEPRPRYWRIREQGGQIYFESSPGGSEWDVEMQTQTPFFVGMVRFRFGTRVDGPMPSGVGIGVPNYNPPL